MRLLDEQVRAHGFDPESSVPLLALVLGISADHGYEPVRAEGAKLSRLIAKAIQRYLIACVGDSPAVILAEDLQWFDSSTLGVVESLLRASTGRLLVVLTGTRAQFAAKHRRAHDLSPVAVDSGRNR